MRTLTTPTDTFDTTATFRLDVGKSVSSTCYVFTHPKEEKIWILSSGACLQDSYTQEQITERNRLNAETPVKHGDKVNFNGGEYTVHVQGAYSDAGYLIPA
jgi:hypothetical protein